MSNKKLLLQVIVDEDDNIGIAYGEDADKNHLVLIGVLEQIKHELIKSNNVITNVKQKYDA